MSIFLAAKIAAAALAFGQTAPAAPPANGLRQCALNDFITIGETATPGIFELHYLAILRGQLASRTHPELFIANDTSTFGGSIVISYAMYVDAQGKAKSPAVFDTIFVTMGGLRAPFTASIDRVRIAVTAGGAKLPLMTMANDTYMVHGVSAIYHASNEPSLPNRVAPKELDRLAGLLDNKPARATLTIDGKPVATLDYAAASLTASKADGQAWAAKVAPLIAQNRCS